MKVFGLVRIKLVICLVKNHNDVGTYILILSLSQVFGNLTLWPYLPKLVNSPKKQDLHFLKHLKPSLALFVPQVATTIYLAVNKTMLWQLDTITAAGYYDYSDKLIKIVLAIVTSAGIVMLPHIANLYAKKQMAAVKSYLYTSFDFVLSISIPLTFGIAAVATTLAPWFFGKSFTSVNSLLIIEAPVIVLIGQSNVIGQQYLLPTKNMRTYTASVVIGAIVNIILNIPLIILWGVKGAMFATLLSELVVTTYQLIMVRHIFKFKKLFTNIRAYLVAGIIMCIVVFGLNIITRPSFINIALQILIGITIYMGMLCVLQPTIFDHLKTLKQQSN
ncbi:lipid II flippase MurJ [Lactiplantibacillus plantarum]|nr:polysaccharide biosynthesis C-terminal domain-containing protein [Lactiplantibacillus plantarum]QHM49155.1 hypothetical protein C7M40_01100 [Lactiplantibacillus plantarum]